MSGVSDDAIGHLQAVLGDLDFGHPRYAIEALLASGGMGTVYRARDRQLDREVAIKVLRRPDRSGAMAQRLAQEAKLLARLDHPGLVPVHDVGSFDDGRPFYVMRFVRGERLDRHLASVPSLALRLRLFLRVLEPVSFAHARGIVHRDLKPANIMIGPFGEVLVLDWGIAKIRGGGTEPIGPEGLVEPGTTGPGQVLGTAGFMAPEQSAGGSGAVDQRADIYALGAVLRELLNGADRPAAAALLAIRDRAMAPEPDRRYPTVGALAEDLSRFLDGAPVEAYRESPIEQLARLGHRHRVAIALVGAYLAMRLLLLAFGRI